MSEEDQFIAGLIEAKIFADTSVRFFKAAVFDHRLDDKCTKAALEASLRTARDIQGAIENRILKAQREDGQTRLNDIAAKLG